MENFNIKFVINITIIRTIIMDFQLFTKCIYYIFVHICILRQNSGFKQNVRIFLCEIKHVLLPRFASLGSSTFSDPHNASIEAIGRAREHVDDVLSNGITSKWLVGMDGGDADLNYGTAETEKNNAVGGSGETEKTVPTSILNVCGGDHPITCKMRIVVQIPMQTIHTPTTIQGRSINMHRCANNNSNICVGLASRCPDRTTIHTQSLEWWRGAR